MHTLPWFRPRLFFYICLAAIFALFSYLTSMAEGASTRSSTTNTSNDTAAAAAPATPADPYLAVLNEIANTSPECKTQADALQALLKERGELLAKSGGAPAVDAVEDLTAKIAAAEAEMFACLQKAAPPEPPPLPPAPPPVDAKGRPIDPEKLTEPYYPKVPPPPVVQVPAAPPRESAYLEFFANHAGTDEEIGSRLSADLRELVDRRREIAARYLAGTARDRYFLANQIGVLSQRIAETTEGLAGEVLDTPPSLAPAA